MPQSKADQISNTQANLPLPEQPPQPSDWQSADARTVNVGAGGDNAARGTQGAEARAQAGLHGAATKGTDMDMSGIGRGVDEAAKKGAAAASNK